MNQKQIVSLEKRIASDYDRTLQISFCAICIYPLFHEQ